MTMHNAHMLLQGFIGYGTHFAILPPVPPPSLIPHISASSLAGLLTKAKYSTTELGMGGIPLVARGSDSGLVVPHISIPPTNTLLPVHIAFGSSKVMFGSSKVKINAGGAQDCGCCLPPFIPFSQNLACNNPCNYPSDYVIAPNTVEVGMTLGDFVGGFISMAVDIGVSWVVGKVAGGLNKAAANSMARRISSTYAMEFWENVADGVTPKFAAMAAKYASNQFVSRWLGQNVAGSLLDNAVQEWVTKPAVEGLMKQVTDPTEAAQDVAHTEAGERPAGGDPPIYGTDNVDPAYVNQDDDWW